MFIAELNFPVENIIFPVGQGGLFLGLIKYQQSQNSKTKTFAYIYDCGNIQQPYLKKSINNLINILKNTNEISPLTHIYIFISHVHNDHISGLKFLKQKLEKCKFNQLSTPVLVMPYMSEDEKKLALILNKIYKRYVGILTDPESYFGGYFDIIYLTDEQDNSRDIAPENKDFSPNSFKCCSIPKTAINSLGIKVFNHSENFTFNTLAGLWVLKPFYQRFDISNYLEKEIKKIGYNSIDSINFDNINNRLKTELKDKLNLSSLCLYSGLLDDRKICGWMHTGDFNFKNQKALENFYKHYVSVLDKVQVLQIPHHGSEKNSSNEIFKIFPNLINKYVTMQENPNGKQEPKLSPEYINDKTIYLATENERIKKYLNLNILIWLKKS